MTTTTTATEPTYQITTYVRGDDNRSKQAWPAETVTEGQDYTLGADLTEMAARFAEDALDNTMWDTTPSRLTVAILDGDGNELVRASVTGK